MKTIKLTENKYKIFGIKLLRALLVISEKIPQVFFSKAKRGMGRKVNLALLSPFKVGKLIRKCSVFVGKKNEINALAAFNISQVSLSPLANGLLF